MNERDHYVRQIDTLVASKKLHGADSLCKLLQYLASHALNFPGEPLKEYKIATEVFGRSSDFAPELDSIVRVQAGRLRARLAKYYESEGANDPIIVKLPRGSYVLSFHHRGKGTAKLHGSASSNGDQREVRLTSGKLGIAVAGLSILLVVSIAAIARLTTFHKSSDASLARSDPPLPPPSAHFSQPFFSGPAAPSLVFANTPFWV